MTMHDMKCVVLNIICLYIYAATTTCLTLAFGGWTSNLIVYLIKEFDMESIDAAQIYNLVNGAGSLIPVVAAIIADSFLGCFSIIWISSIISLLVQTNLCFVSILII